MSRILIAGLCAVPGPDRAGVQLGHVLRALAPQHSVDVLCARRGDQPYVERLGSARILRVPLPEPEPQAQVDGFRRAVGRQLEGAEYDIAHVRDGWAGKPVLEARERLRYALVFDATRSPRTPRALGTDLYPEGPEPQADLLGEFLRDEDELLLAADLVLAPHEPARRHIAARGLPGRVRVVRPGVDVDQFDYDEIAAAGPPRLLYLGGLEPGRGVRLLLRAMVDVARQTSALLTLAGPSEPGFERMLRAELAESGLEDRVEILGRVDHHKVPGLIASSLICIAPAAVELVTRTTALYPTKLLEYMACRRAVVAPRCDAVALLAKEGLHAELFRPGDPGSLAASLIGLLEAPARREALAEAGYQMVRSRCTASGTRRQLRAAYRVLAAQPGWGGRLSEVLGSPEAAPIAILGEENQTTELSDGDLMTAASPVTETNQNAVDSEHTRVDQHGAGWLERGTDVSTGIPSAEAWSVEDSGGRAALADSWDHASKPEQELADEGTPVDLRVGRASTSPVDSRFMAGEIDVDSSDEIDRGASIFTAVGELLGAAPATALIAGDGDEIRPQPDTDSANQSGTGPRTQLGDDGPQDG